MTHLRHFMLTPIVQKKTLSFSVDAPHTIEVLCKGNNIHNHGPVILSSTAISATWMDDDTYTSTMHTSCAVRASVC